MHRKTAKKKKVKPSSYKTIKSTPHGDIRQFSMAPVFTHDTGEKIAPAHKYKEFTSWGGGPREQVQKFYDYEIYNGRNSQED